MSVRQASTALAHRIHTPRSAREGTARASPTPSRLSPLPYRWRHSVGCSATHNAALSASATSVAGVLKTTTTSSSAAPNPQIGIHCSSRRRCHTDEHHQMSLLPSHPKMTAAQAMQLSSNIWTHPWASLHRTVGDAPLPLPALRLQIRLEVARQPMRR